MTEPALGLRHQRVARLRRLVAKPSARDAERRFVAEGAKAVGCALAAGAELEALYIDRAATLNREGRRVLEAARRSGVRVVGLLPGVIERVADAATPQPLLGVVGFVDRDLDAVSAGAVLVLVDVRDPGNVGTVIRSADAAGIDAVVLCSGCCDLYNPKTVRASAGSIFHVPLVRAGAAGDVLAALARRGFALVATTAREAEDYATAQLAAPVALVFGNEAHGLDPGAVALCSRAVTVPIAGGAESLNVAMAATAIAFELARRRRLVAARLA